MKRPLLYLVLSLVAVSSASCVRMARISTFPQAEIALTDGYLVNEGGNVHVALHARLAEEYRNIHTGIRVEPVFDDGGTNKRELPPFVVDGPLHRTFNDRMKHFSPGQTDGAGLHKRYGKEGSEVLYAVDVPYDEWMGKAAFYADLYADAYTEERYLGRVIIANGMLDLRSLMEFTPFGRSYPYTGQAAKVCRRGDFTAPAGTVVFGFDACDIPFAEQTADSFREYMQALCDDPALKDYRVSVRVANSPEGSLSYNEALGQKRLESLLDLLRQTGVASGKLTTEVADEDWDTLLEALPDLGLDHGSQIEEIIRSESDPDRREERIRREYPGDFVLIASKVYPRLRTGRITVTAEYKDDGTGGEALITESTFDQSGYTIEEAVRSDDGRNIVKRLNDQMLAQFAKGGTKEAGRTADLIPNTFLPDTVRHNKALVLIADGRFREAKSLLKGVANIPEAAYNLGLLQLRDGEYDPAAGNLDGFSDINAAIANLHVGCNERAADILHLLRQSPERDYLLAIACARLNRKQEARELLASATAASPALKEKAKYEPDLRTLEERPVLAPSIR